MKKTTTATKKKAPWNSQPKVEPAKKKASPRTKSANPNAPATPLPLKMVYRVPPGKSSPGPYCEVLFPVIKSNYIYGKMKQEDGTVKQEVTGKTAPRLKTVSGWAKVHSGDERNGSGVVHSHSPVGPEGAFPIGTKIRWGGGTKQTAARIILNTPSEVPVPKEVVVVG